MKRRGILTLLVAALALPAGASAQYRPGYPPPYRGGGYGPQGSVDGFVTHDRGRCLALRDHQRRTFYLSGDTYDLRPGDHVTLRERTLSRSYCGNDGPTLEVLEIRTVWTGRDHRSAFFDSRRDGDFAGFLMRNRDRGGWYSERYSYHRNRDQYGRDQYGREGDRYGDRYDPNGPSGRQGRPDGQYAPPHDQGQPQYEPDDQYDRNGQYDQEDDSDQNGQPPYDDQYDRNDRNGGNRPISVDGTLEFDRSCPAVVGSDGTWYDLAGDLRNYHDGDRVHIVGVVSGSSSCGGRALEIQEIRRR